ncbi:MAG: hypothetical protein AB1333_04410 [Patescibacteria group bacterium]
MNFLEQLAAEWYEYSGYFVRTNIKFGPRARGGYFGEIDVVGYKSETREFIHVETSTDSDSWKKREVKFKRKFSTARRHYMEVFRFKDVDIRPIQIAIVGFNLKPSDKTKSWKSSPPTGSLYGKIKIEVIHIPKFLHDIYEKLKDKDPQKDAIPESYPLLRAIQYSAFYNKK